MDIRKLTANDASAYLTIRHCAVREEPESFSPTFEEEQKKDVAVYEQ